LSPGEILKSKFPAELVDALLTAYAEIEGNYALGKWKASELDAGHFVEAARRILEFELFEKKYTPIGKDLPKFVPDELKRYVEQGKGDEAFRIHIPRILWGVYGIRNKRGIAHVGTVSPNEMDATLILYDAKWVLAEFIRQASGLSPDETQRLVDEIIERRLSVLWKHGDVTRVLVQLTAREQVLVLLYDENNQHESKLLKAVEYNSASDFRKILRVLHTKRLIEYREDAVCVLSPTGVIAAEEILRRLKTSKLAT
jgi:hypothetical protein